MSRRAVGLALGLVALLGLSWSLQRAYFRREATRALLVRPSATQLLLAQMNVDDMGNLMLTEADTISCVGGGTRQIAPEMLRSLAEQEADLNVLDHRGRRPLHLAAMYGDRDLVRLLLDHGADMEGRDGLGRTPLMWAVGRGNLKTLRSLLERGAAVNARDAKGRTALIRAARFDPRAVRVLLAHGADPEMKDVDGWTPLMIAVSAREAESVRILLAHGADPNAVNRRRQTPLLLAVDRSRFLVQTGPLVPKPEIVRLLLDHGARVTTRNRRGESLLMVARRAHASPGARRQGVEILRLLRRRGAPG